ncbi:MAG TPA: endolytic transglycosylase MltG [Steroidobacteraceae bacterium]|nr:endolytic transglycosylase MltG [Steroidobacteraceae bacterium]
MVERTTRARRWLRRAGWAGVALVVLLVVAATVVHDRLRREYLSPGPAAAPSRIQVAQGASVRAVLTRLESEGVVHSARAVLWYLRLLAEHPSVQAGTYEIPAHASPEQIITMFEEGRVLLEQLTVVEGSTFAEFLELLAHEPDVTHTLAGKTPGEVMATLGHPGENPEGRFFPDTYRFAANTADTVILGLAYEKMSEALAATWSARSPKLPFDTAAQALILASMVEKEAQLKSERTRIAGVFVARLRKGMRLQSDPTVIYGLGAKYDGQIHTRDLLTDTPYNTYTRAGLPPTPIALPGRESLLAAVRPDETGELYFVASGLGDGAHHFSKSLEEHNSAVKAYLARLRQQRAAAHAAGAPAGHR